MNGYDIRCPRCRGTHLWRSGRGWVRHLARLVSLYPVRCDHCHKRFWRFTLNPPPGRGRRAVGLA